MESSRPYPSTRGASRTTRHVIGGLASNVVSLALALASEVKSLALELKPLVLIFLAVCALFFMFIGLILWIY